MDVRVVRAGHLATVGAEWVARALRDAGRPDPTLMPALGSSALPIYRELAAADPGVVHATGLRLVQLDEYHPLEPGDPRSLLGWLRRDVSGPLRVPDERIVALDGRASDPETACRAWDAAVAAAGGIDVAVLGLGPNGHLGFNEPPAPADAPTRLVDLTPESLTSNARYWPGLDVPRAALTAGMSAILAARRILLVVTGAAKRSILLDMLSRPIGPDLPATYVRSHPSVLLLVDQAAWPMDRPGPG